MRRIDDFVLGAISIVVGRMDFEFDLAKSAADKAKRGTDFDEAVARRP